MKYETSQAAPPVEEGYPEDLRLTIYGGQPVTLVWKDSESFQGIFDAVRRPGSSYAFSFISIVMTRPAGNWPISSSKRPRTA
jgi:hypothetical protein